MSQMGVTQLASHLGARHAMRQIGVLGNQIVADGARKGRPTAARIIFVGREKQRLPGGDVDIDARPKLVVVGIGKGMFGGRLLRNGILFGGEHLAQRGIVALDVLVGIVDFHTFDIVYYVVLPVAVAGRKEQDAP